MRDPAGVSRPILPTERPELRPLTPEHLPLLVELGGDPEVLRHILGRSRTREEAERFWSPRCSDTVADATGLGRWAGFRLSRQHWREGLRTEGATELVRHGFEEVGPRRIWAETMTVNTASRRVMVKLGMRARGR